MGFRRTAKIHGTETKARSRCCSRSLCSTGKRRFTFCWAHSSLMVRNRTILPLAMWIAGFFSHASAGRGLCSGRCLGGLRRRWLHSVCTCRSRIRIRTVPFAGCGFSWTSCGHPIDASTRFARFKKSISFFGDTFRLSRASHDHVRESTTSSNRGIMMFAVAILISNLGRDRMAEIGEKNHAQNYSCKWQE